MRHKAFDFYIGLFVVGGLAVIGYMILTFGGMSTRNRYEVFVVFDDVGGLVKEAPVRYAGVECGVVGRIIPWGEPVEDRPDIRRDRVKVVLSLDGTTTLREKDEIRIVPVSLLGEMAVQIVPGPLEARKVPKVGAPVREGVNATGLLELVGELFGPVPQVMENLRRLTGEGGPLTQTISGINRVVNESLPAVVANVRDVAVEAEKFLAENREKVSALVQSANQTVKLSSEMVENLKRLTDEGGPLTETMEELRGAVDDVRGVAQAIQPVMANLGAGKGGLAKLINDPSWYENFNKLLLALRKYGLVHADEAYKEEQSQAKRSPREPMVWSR